MIRQRLLETPAADVPAGLTTEVVAFCQAIPEIRSAYVGLTEVTRDFDFPQRQLAIGFELADGDPESAEGGREVELVANRFYESMSEEIQAGGCNILEPAALEAWREKAVRVYPVAAGTSP